MNRLMASLKKKEGLVCQKKCDSLLSTRRLVRMHSKRGDTPRKGISKPSSRDLDPADPPEPS
jgi:hypothetical protein